MLCVLCESGNLIGVHDLRAPQLVPREFPLEAPCIAYKKFERRQLLRYWD